MEIFCNVINAFSVTFDQFNVLFLNKSINFILLTLNSWTVVYGASALPLIDAD